MERAKEAIIPNAAIEATDPRWVEDVLEFWFGLAPEAWFEKSDEIDRECATRFRDVHDRLMASDAADQVISARRALAAVIVLDQFSRNIYRGTLRAFASDPLAKDRSVSLFGSLDDDYYLNFAIAHRDIVARFGRFPHRNAILGRPSTPEEIAFLSEPGSSF